MTALIAAAARGRATVVRLLLLQGADAMATDDVSSTDEGKDVRSGPGARSCRPAKSQLPPVLAPLLFPPHRTPSSRPCSRWPQKQSAIPRCPRLSNPLPRPTLQEGNSAWDRASSVRCREALAHTEPLQRWHRRCQLVLWAPQRATWWDDVVDASSLDSSSPVAASEHVHWEIGES